MYASSHIIKPARTQPGPRHASELSEAAHAPPAEAPEDDSFIGGIIRHERAQREARPILIDGPEWAAGTPAEPDPLEDDDAPLDYDALRATWEAEWEQRAIAEREEAVATAREEAYAEGFAAAQEEYSAQAEAVRAAFADDAARLRAMWEDHLNVADPLLVGLAVEIAEAVLDVPLGEEARDAMTTAVISAIERFAAQPPLVVTLHPVDHLRLQEAGMVDALTATHPGLRWVPDPALAEGDWSLDAAGAAVRHVRAEVLCDLRRRLDLEADPAPGDATSA